MTVCFKSFSLPEYGGLLTSFFLLCSQFLLDFKGYRPYLRSHGILFSTG